MRKKKRRASHEWGDLEYLINCFPVQIVAQIMRVSERTVERWRVNHGMPSVKIGGRRLYFLPDVLKWVRSRSCRRAVARTAPDERPDFSDAVANQTH